MKTLSIDSLLKSANKQQRPAQVNASEIERNSCIWILTPTADQRDLCEVQWANYSRAFLKEGNVGFRKFLVAWCLCDEKNQQLLDPGPEENRVTPEFIKQMNELGTSMPLPVMIRAFDVALAQMGMSEKDIEELEGNSETTHTDDGSGSKPKRKAKAAKRGSKSSKTPKS